MRLENRVQRLEAFRSGGGVTAIVWQTLTETKEQALERWTQEHPGQGLEELQVYVVRWSPPHEVARGPQ